MQNNRNYTTIIFKGEVITRHADGRWHHNFVTHKSVNAAKRAVLKLISA